MDNSIKEFKNRLNRLIDKYYKNQLFKGAILTFILIGSILLFVLLFEYLNYFSSNTRLFLLLASIISFLFIFGYFIFFPLLRFLNIASRLSYFHTSELIRKAFPDTKDQIINIIELEQLNKENELALASIEQKIKRVSVHDFSKAISYKSNRGLFKYLAIIALLYLFIFFVKPEIIKESSNRILHYNTEFEKNVGYSISIDTSTLFVEKGDDFKLNAKIKGEHFPDELYMKIGNDNFLLEKVNESMFSHTFKNVNQNFTFFIYNDEYSSKRYKLRVLDSPILNKLTVNLEFPEYTNKENKSFENISNFNVPRGTIVNFNFKTKDVDSLFIIKDSLRIESKRDERTYSYSIKSIESYKYSISIVNSYFSRTLLNESSVIVVPDFYPTIAVNQILDEKNKNVVYFKGNIEDDYGFTKLAFFVNEKQTGIININKNIQKQEFYYGYEFQTNIDNKNYKYYFLVYDNDFVTGPKFSKSQVFTFKIPDKNEIIKESEKNADKIAEKLDKGLLMAKELTKDIEEIQKSLINNNLKTWEKKELVNNLVQKQKQLEELIKNISSENKEKFNKENSYNDLSDEIKDKQKLLQELMENVMTEELKKLMEELQKLQNEFDEKKLNELSDDLKFNYEDLNKELDKNLELLKRFELEKNIESIIDEIENLAKEHKETVENTANRNFKKDSLVSKNDEIRENLKDLEETYIEQLENNEELEKPFNLESFKKEFEEIEKGIEEDNEKLKSGKQKEKVGEETNEKMKKLAERMDKMMESNQQANEGENAETLRQILENLITFSFTQESLLNEYKSTSYDSPKFIELNKQQLNLKGNFSIIKDSLYALAKRTSYLGSHISKTTFTIEDKLYNIEDYINERKIGEAVKDQQFAMKYANDLILLLAESLKNMESMGGGGGSNSKNKKRKPSKGEPSLSEMRKSQESMKKQLENMINQMKNGQKPGGKPSNSELGKMLAQQEIFQQMLDKLSQGNVGEKTSEKLNEIKQLLEQNKRDIINMQLSQQTLNRQHKIVTRLLEAENAEMERDKDEQRKASEAKEYEIKYPDKMFEQKEENINFNETLYRNSILLDDFYKLKYQEYMKNINK